MLKVGFLLFLGVCLRSVHFFSIRRYFSRSRWQTTVVFFLISARFLITLTICDIGWAFLTITNFVKIMVHFSRPLLLFQRSGRLSSDAHFIFPIALFYFLLDLTHLLFTKSQAQTPPLFIDQVKKIKLNLTTPLSKNLIKPAHTHSSLTSYKLSNKK